MMDEIIKPGLVLLLITVIAALCLGLTYEVTKEPIARQQVEETAESMRKLLPAAEEFKEDAAIFEDADIIAVTTGYAGGEAVGYVIEVAPKGYAGKIQTLVGIDAGGTLTGVEIVEHSETPGLGANAKEPAFTGQFIGKSGELAVTKSGASGENEIQAITSATITSNAVTNGVNAALNFYKTNIQ